MVNTLIIIALILSLVGMFVFATIFTWKANWRASQLGRHMVYFGWVFSAALATNLIRVIVDGPVIDGLRIVSLFVLAAVIWQRVYIMAKSLRGSYAED